MPAHSHFRKGIILAGGSGSRLLPLTRATSKQLLPVYDKPMVYYPLSVLMEAGIREILIISTPTDIGGYQRLLGDGVPLGLAIRYVEQPKPEGLAQAFILGRDFVGTDHCALVLGDNILCGHTIGIKIRAAIARDSGATVFCYPVDDPRRYGVVELDANGKPTILVEKPSQPSSRYAVIGLYFYDNRVLDFAVNLKPSARGELEITDLNQVYLERGELNVEVLDESCTWIDAGTPQSLLEAAQFVRHAEVEQGNKIGCIEEIAYHKGFIDAVQLERLAASMGNEYGRYLEGIASAGQR